MAQVLLQKGLTAKQRVKLAIAHKESDRIPIQFYSAPEVRSMLQKVFPGRSIEDVFDVDFRYVASEGGPEERVSRAAGSADYYDGWGTGYSRVRNHSSGDYFEATDLPLARLLNMDQVLSYAWPDATNFDYSVIQPQIDQVQDYAVVLGGARVPDIINGIGRGRGMEQVLLDIITEDEVGIAIIDARIDYYYEWCKRCLEAGKGRIDILHIGEDLGSQKGPMVSPACYNSFFRPRLGKFIDLAHNYDALAMLHSCGSTRLLLPQLIDMGVDILDSVQPEPEGMAPEELKADFGDKITFCGMISTQETLPHRTVEECRAEARHRLDVIGQGGGYIFAPAHWIQPDTPIENILAIYEEAIGKNLMHVLD